MEKELKGKGPYTKIEGKSTDVGLHNHVFDGTDESYNKLIKAEKLQKHIRQEMLRRGLIKESLEDTVKMITESL